MWRLLVTVFVFIASSSFIVADAECVDNFHKICESSGVITSIEPGTCSENKTCNGNLATCKEDCEGKLILNLKNYSAISLPDNHSPLDFVSVEFTNSDESCKQVTIPSDLFLGMSSLKFLELECVKLTSEKNHSKIKDALEKVSLRRMDFSQDTTFFLTNVTNLTTLTLDKVKIGVIDTTTFAGDVTWSTVKHLNLTDNDLTDIKVASFQKISSLEELNIINNSLTTLESGIFKGLEKLRSLGLQNNKITELGDDTFIGLKKLETLYLSNNEIRKIESGPIKKSGIQNLWLEGNKFEPENCTQVQMPSELFTSMPSLKFLELDCKNLTSQEVSTETKTTLEKVSWRRINISQNTQVFLTSIKDFTTLTIDKVNISVIDNTTFPENVIWSTVKLLNLTHNNLTEIGVSSFQQFSSLEELNIINNSLTNLKSGVFNGLASLRSLGLQNNTIEKLLYNSFIGLRNLKTLYLSNNRISQIDSGTFWGSRIRSLWLDGNELEHMPSEVTDNLKFLTHLTLASNKISTVGADDFKGFGKIDLDLSCNYIERIVPNAFKGLGSSTNVADEDRKVTFKLSCNNITKTDKDRWGLDTSVTVEGLDGKDKCETCNKRKIEQRQEEQRRKALTTMSTTSSPSTTQAPISSATSIFSWPQLSIMFSMMALGLSLLSI